MTPSLKEVNRLRRERRYARENRRRRHDDDMRTVKLMRIGIGATVLFLWLVAYLFACFVVSVSKHY